MTESSSHDGVTRKDTPRDVHSIDVQAYDAEAEATGWFGPEVAFGLVYERTTPGQTVLDLGIGTGRAAVLFRKAGLRVCGLDLSPQMLEACRTKGLDELVLHDLTKAPYPYAPQSFDHVVCLGVLPFLSDPALVFAETARLLRPGGTVVFMTLDRAAGESEAFTVGSEHTKSELTVTMYRHGDDRLQAWSRASGLDLGRALTFIAYRDSARAQPMAARCSVALKPT